jgi:2-amino-4-hydroxy-6-hydroxymethyldihydropteridine diphosphokinase
MSQFCEDRNGETTKFRHLALIGIGANLPAPDGTSALATCSRAVAALDLFPGVFVKGLSRWFVSAPIPASDQPPYVNAVVAALVDPDHQADPARLLAYLMQIETTSGRKRSVPNAPRTLDLDLIAVGDLVRTKPDPILPHPRAHLRAFVLAPLNDVAPDWIHPVLGRTARSLLAELPPQDIQPLEIDDSDHVLWKRDISVQV